MPKALRTKEDSSTLEGGGATCQINRPFPSHLGVHDEVVLNKVFRFGLMPSFMIEHPVVLFHPYHPKSNPSNKLLRSSLPKDGLLPVKVIFACSSPTKLMQDEGGPPLSTPHMSAIPKLVFNQLARIGNTNYTSLGDGVWSDVGLPFSNCDGLMPNGSHGRRPLCRSEPHPKLETNTTCTSQTCSLVTCQRPSWSHSF